MITSSMIESFVVSSLCTLVYLAIVIKLCFLHEVIVKSASLFFPVLSVGREAQYQAAGQLFIMLSQEVACVFKGTLHTESRKAVQALFLL